MNHAIYFECADDETTFQSIFFPSCLIGRTQTSPRIATRTITTSRPNARWNIVANQNYSRPEANPDAPLSEYLVNELEQISSISTYFLQSLGDPGLNLIGSFPVLLTDSNLLALIDAPTEVPNDLLVRIIDRRFSLGWNALPGRKS